MVVLIAGASHTGKTLLAQKLLKKYGFPYLSIDHLKMGMIRCGYTQLTPEDDREMTAYLWPILREMIKTAIENGQNLVLEGCYIPFSWERDFTGAYRKEIRAIWLVMSEGYIRRHFDRILAHASDIEDRGDDSDCTLEAVLWDNAETLTQCRAHHCKYLLIEDHYQVDWEP